MPFRFLGRRQAASYFVLVGIAGAFGALAQFFARHGDWVGAATASGLGLLVGFYVLFRLWRLLPRPAWSLQITREGWLFLLALALVAFGSVTSANNLLFLVLSCMLAAMVVSGLFSRLNLADLELSTRVPEEIFAGRDAPVRVTLRNAKRWLPSFSIRLEIDLEVEGRKPEAQVPLLGGRQTCTLALNLLFPRRGRYQQDTFWLTSAFPFGFFRRRARLRMPREIVVYPRITSAEIENALPKLASEWERYRAGLGQELYRIRPYQTGDSSRIVHWKASAHTGELKVREFSVEEDRRVEILFDRAIPPGALWQVRFERAVELCAAAAWCLHARGAVLRFQPGERENIYDILRYLALVEPDPGGPPLAAEPSGMFQVIFTAQPQRLTAALPESSYYCYALENL